MLRGMSLMFLTMIHPHQYCSSNMDLPRGFSLDPTRFTPISVIKVFFHGNQNSSTTNRKALQRSSLNLAAQRPLATTPSPAASIPTKDIEGNYLHKVQVLTGKGKSLFQQRWLSPQSLWAESDTSSIAKSQQVFALSGFGESGQITPPSGPPASRPRC